MDNVPVSIQPEEDLSSQRKSIHMYERDLSMNGNVSPMDVAKKSDSIYVLEKSES